MNLYTVYSTPEDLLIAVHQQSLRSIYKYNKKGPRKRQDLPKYYQSPEKIFGQTIIAPGDPLADAIPDRQEFLAQSDRTNGPRLLRHVLNYWDIDYIRREGLPKVCKRRPQGGYSEDRGVEKISKALETQSRALENLKL